MKRKKAFYQWFVFVLFAVCAGICGCGSETAIGDTASDSAVSGNAVSDGEATLKTVSDKKEKTVREETWKYHYSTDTNLYVYDSYEDGESITQMRLDGTHEKEIVRIGVIEQFGLCYVWNGWLYYEIEGEKGDILYRVPIGKGDDGYDVVKMSEKEELVKEEEIYDVCLDSNYLTYDNGVEVVTYDLQKKEPVSEWEYPEDTTGNGGLMLFCLNGEYVCLNEGRGVFVQEQGGTEWKNCYASYQLLRKFSEIRPVQTQSSLLFIDGTEEQESCMKIMKCDGKTVQCFLTEKQIREFAETVKGVDSDGTEKCAVTGLYETNGRLYLQVEFDWYEGDDICMEYLLFSQGEDESGLHYEKELTECMQSQVRERSQKAESGCGYRNRITNDAQCAAMLNGCAYLSLYDYEKDEGRMGCYEISTGKFRWVPEEEVWYGELARAYMPDDLSEVFMPAEYRNEYVGFAGL